MTFTICSFRDGPMNGHKSGVRDNVDSVFFGETEKVEMLEALQPENRDFVIHRYRRSTVTHWVFTYDGEDGKPKRDIPFTQYVLPHGRRQPLKIEVCHDVADIADALLGREKGRYALECEVLRTGQVSLTIADMLEEVDADIRLLANGTGVPEAVENMLRNFNVEEWEKGLKE